MVPRIQYPSEPDDTQAFTAEFDRFYTRFARAYDRFVKLLPVWRRWIGHVLPHVQGPRVLEVSFGTGALLDRYGPQAVVYALEYNRTMLEIARRNLGPTGRAVSFQRGDVAHLPYQSGAFDTLVNTMAFTGYPDGAAAMMEMARVLRPGGRLVMVDVNPPQDGNRTGVWLARAWSALGDILRDMEPLFRAAGLAYVDREIGGWGSVHLYVATKGG
jgi:ubiquinone/menaquinone biosynthesis C-methylase UbiE